MQVLRKEVGRKTYKGKTITARFLGPDLLGERYIDDEEKANQPTKRKKK